jgi:integrase
MNTGGTEKNPQRRDSDGLHKRRGIWHFKINVNGKWREISTHTRIYSEANDVRKRSIQSHDAGRLSLDSGKVPFKNAAEIWTSSRKGDQLAENTLRVERERLNPLLRTFGEKKLSTFSIEDILAYRADRSETVGPRTINLEIKVLRMILQRAKCWNGLADDYKALREDTKGPGIALSLDEERKLFENASAKLSWEAAYLGGLVAVNTTMRGGELRGLRLGAIDLFTKTVSIRRNSTKTDAGCRVIPLNDTAMWAFVRLLRRAERLGATESDHYVFPAFMFRHTKEAIEAKAIRL